MTYNLKKEHVTNWDARNINDEGDSPISERTSIASTIDDIEPKKSPSPPPPAPPAKVPHSLRYYYNDVPENGVPLATQYKRVKAEEKKRQRNIRKAPPGQGSLAPLPEGKPPGMSENFYPYWHYYKVKNPDWQLRHRQTADGQLIPYDSFDASKYTQEPALSVSPIKSNERSRERREKTSAKQYIPLKDPDRDAMPVSRRTRHRRRRNEKDPYTQSTTDSSKFEESTATEKKKKHHHNRHHHHDHHHHTHKPVPPVPEPSAHHPHNHHHHHHHHHLPSFEYVNSEFLVSDQSYKRVERSPFFQPLQGISPSPPPAIYNQSSYLPPINTRPTAWNYYGTPSDHTLSRDWIEPVNEHKVYKADPQTRFYDRYLNNIIDKRLTAL